MLDAVRELQVRLERQGTPRAGDTAQLVERLPQRLDDLRSIPQAH